MLRRLAMLVGLVLVGLAGLAAYLGNADLGRYKDRLTPLVSESLGRDVRIDGPASLRLGQPVRVRVNDLVVANAPWADDPTMLRAAQFSAEIDFWSLVRGPLRVERVDVKGATLQLAVSETGQRNWAMATPADDNGPAPDAAERLPHVPTVSVRDSRILVSAPALTRQSELAMKTAAFGLRDGVLVVEMDAAMNGADFRLAGEAGPPDQLARLEDFDITFDAALDDFALNGRIGISDARTLAVSTAGVTLDGPDAGRFFDILNLPVLTSGAVHLEATLTPDPRRSGFRASAVLGEYRATADGWFRDASGFDVQWQAAGPDLASVGQLFGSDALPGGAFEGGGSVRAEPGRYSLDDVSVTFDDLTVTGSASAARRNDGGKTVTVDTDLGDTTLRLSANTRSGLSPDGASFLVDIEGPDADRAGRLAGMTGLPPEAFAVQGEGRHAAGIVTLDSLRVELGGQRVELSGRVSLDANGGPTNLAFSTGELNLVRYLDAPERLQPMLRSVTGSGRLRATAERLTFAELVLKAGPASWTGNVDVRIGDDETRLAIDVEGPDAAAAAGLLGVDTFPAGPYSFSAGLARRGPLLNIDAARLALGDQRLEVAGRVGFADARDRTELDIEGRQIDLSPWVRMDGDLAKAVTAVTASGRLRQSGGALTLDDVSLSAGRAALNGRVVLASAGERGEFDLQVEAPSAGYLHAALAPYPLAAESVYLQVAGTWQPGALDLGRAALRIADRGTLQGSIRLERGEKPSVAADLSATRLDLRTAKPDADPAPTPATDGRLIPAAEVPLDWLDALDGEVRVAVDELYGPFSAGGRLRLHATLRDRHLDVDEVDIAGKRGRIRASLSARPVDASYAINLVSEGTDLYVAPPEEPEASLATRPSYSLSASLDARGASLRELAGTLNGVVQIQSGPGTVARQSGLLATLVLEDFLTRTLETINPITSTRDTIELNCLVLRADIADGRASGNPLLAMQTREVNLLARGNVDLGSEALDIDIAAQPRQGLGISLGDLVNPFTRIGGTLGAPAIVADPKTGIAETGAGIATAGLWPLAKKLHERFLAGNPCAKALEQMRDGRAGP